MWRRIWQRRWYRSAVVWSVIVAMLVVAGVARYTYLAYQSAATELVIERDRQVALLSAARLRSELTKFSDVLFGLARRRDVFDGNPETQRAALRQASARLAVFDGGVVVLDSAGIVRASEPFRPAVTGQDWSDREHFRAVLARPDVYVSDAVADGPESSLVVAIVVPILGDQSQFAGALVGMFRLGEVSSSSFYASIVRLRLGQSGSTYVVDGLGRILFHTNPERVGRFVTRNQLPMVRNLTEASAVRMVDEEGHDIVASFAPVPGTSWTLATEDDWAILTRSTRRYANIFLLSLGVAIALPPLGMALLSRQRRFQPLERWDAAHNEHLASLFQSELLPKQLPVLPGWSLSCRHVPGERTSREFYDATIMHDGRLMLALGRVRQTGIHAAFAFSSVRAMLRSAANQLAEPGEALRQSNALLCAGFPDTLETSLIYAVLDPLTGDLEYANAGQHPPLLCGEPASDVQPFGSNLGMDLDVELHSGSIRVKKQCCVVLVNKALIEARAPGGTRFCRDRLPAIMDAGHASADELAEAILSEFEFFRKAAGTRKRQVTLIVLRRGYDDAIAQSAQGFTNPARHRG